MKSNDIFIPRTGLTARIQVEQCKKRRMVPRGLLSLSVERSMIVCAKAINHLEDYL
jgi:hypothetical protein